MKRWCHLSAAAPIDLMRQYAGARIAFYSTQVSASIFGSDLLIRYHPADINSAFDSGAFAEYVPCIPTAALT